MWRIYGLIFFNDKDHFVEVKEKRFNQPLLEAFLREKGVAIYDTACAVNRLQGNASDKFLEVVEATDVAKFHTATLLSLQDRRLPTPYALTFLCPNRR